MPLKPHPTDPEKMVYVSREYKLPEAIAWMVYTQDGQSVYVTDNPTDIQEGQRALPLYTAPPQRPWVGLTDKEILADDVLRYYFGLNGGAGPVSKSGRKIVDALEAKLKEKNT